MPRHAGSTVDTVARTVRDRDGVTYPLDRLELADGALYHARPLDFHSFDYHERWVLPAQGWAISRLRWVAEPQLDWYIEPDIISVEGHTWTIADGLLDVELYEGHRYQVDDADELAEAIELGQISLEDGLRVLRNFHSLERALRLHRFSGASLLASYVPSLAGFQTPERAGVG